MLLQVGDIGIDRYQRAIVGRVIANEQPRPAGKILLARAAFSSSREQGGEPRFRIIVRTGKHAARQPGANKALKRPPCLQLDAGQIAKEFRVA
jgi:hypothetical protein